MFTKLRVYLRDWRRLLLVEIALILVLKIIFLHVMGAYCFAHPIENHLTPTLMYQHFLSP